MEKTELMKRFTKETAIGATNTVGIGNELLYFPSEKYVDWLEAKASAYDRLMSGGKKTLNEWANLLGRPVAMDFGGVVESYNTIPMRCDSAGYWYCDEYSENFEDEHFIIPKECFDYTGSWQDSLTLPDGWEETKDDKRA